LRNYEKEHYLPKLFDKHFRGPWETAGGKRIEEVAKEKLRAILSTHRVSPLDPDTRKQLEQIIQNQRKVPGN
jgi:trimethylamine:corrinoid methyltransferase-like protein